MKYLRQFFIITAVSFVGEIFHALIPLPVPAGIYGIIVMMVCLCTKVIPLESVKPTGMFLVEIMPVMFVPAAVGLVKSWNIIQPGFVQYIIVTVITTVVVMVVSGLITQLFIRQSQKTEDEKND